MSNRVIKSTNPQTTESDVKYIKKVTAQSSTSTLESTVESTTASSKDKESTSKATVKVYGMPCLPQHAD